jgi:hypothetical protein
MALSWQLCPAPSERSDQPILLAAALNVAMAPRWVTLPSENSISLADQEESDKILAFGDDLDAGH